MSDPTPRVRRDIAVVRLRTGVCRITRPSGLVLGYVEPRPGDLWAAARLAAGSTTRRPIGEFRSFDDAVDSLRGS